MGERRLLCFRATGRTTTNRLAVVTTLIAAEDPSVAGSSARRAHHPDIISLSSVTRQCNFLVRGRRPAIAPEQLPCAAAICASCGATRTLHNGDLHGRMRL